MGKSEPRRALFIAQLKNDTDQDRLINVVPSVLRLLKRFSDDEQEQAFRSNDGTLFGYFLKTAADFIFIRAEFEKLPETRNGDTVLVIELGDDFNGVGFSRAWTWLQHH